MPKKVSYLLPKYELDLIQSGQYKRIVGIDEAGRGCLAGPVAVGAYVFESKFYKGVHDSKKLSRSNRESVYNKLCNHEFTVALGTNSDIDKKGLARVLEELIMSVIEKYNSIDTYFLIDGQFKSSFVKNSRKVIKGDSTYYSIAAASIMAKVERDNLMFELAKKYLNYGFENHVGYGTREHRLAIKTLGPCEIHRKSFAPFFDLQMQFEI